MPDQSSTHSDRGFTLFVATLALIISIGAILAVAFKLDNTDNTSATSMMWLPSRSGRPPGPKRKR
jgi:hypothetical protein